MRVIKAALASFLIAIFLGNLTDSAVKPGSPLTIPWVVPIGQSKSQELKHFVSVVNIEVPVRVFKGDKFVDNLSISDFEVYENGKLQKIEAVYLIKKTSIKKEEAPAKVQFKPEVKKRHFVLIFEMDDYLPELNKVLDYFFKEVLASEDTVWVVTPATSIQLKKDMLTQMPREKIAEQLKFRLKKDIRQRTLRLQSLIEDLKRLQETDVWGQELVAGNIAQQIADLKMLDEPRIAEFAGALKQMEGQKHAFLFYQKEAYRVPAQYVKTFEAHARQDYIDKEKIQRLFTDASTSIHFLFVTKTGADFQDSSYRDPGSSAVFEQGSGDFFSAFREIAVATGGLRESSANPAFMFQKAVEASENYYLLYYKPSDYKADGKYKEIEVKVKGGNYQVTHRAGYIER
jgi:VWFA-related protein